MSMLRWTTGILFVGLFSSLLTLGCKGNQVKTVAVTGRVTKGQQPLKLSKEGVLQVIFIPAEGGANTYPAAVENATGSYRVSTIPVGKYRVAVEALDPYPSHDKLQGAFGLGNSPIIRDITDNQTINIDLDKPKE